MFSRRTWSFIRSSSRSARLTRLGLATSGGLIGGTVFLPPILAEYVSDQSGRRSVSLSSLLRSYAVYSMVSLPGLVDYSPKILSLCTSVPGLREITHAVVRQTFFAQFVGGDSALDALSVVHRYRKENIGTLFAYSVEVDEDEAAHGKKAAKTPAHKAIVEEMIHSIDVAADYEDHLGFFKGGRRTWVAVKISALVPDPKAFEHLSTYLVRTRQQCNPPIAYPGTPNSMDFLVLKQLSLPNNIAPLTSEDITALRELRDDLWRICRKAQERGVKIIMDAEYTWYQPAIDAFTLDLMKEFNKIPSRSIFSSTRTEVQPLIYATYQAYLRRTPQHLEHSLRDAKASGYSLGVKLVRGAYHSHETIAHTQRPVSGEELPPVWLSKSETHICYNACAKLLLDQIQTDITSPAEAPRIGVLFGTHNAESCDLILEGLRERGLAKETKTDAGGVPIFAIGDQVAERVTFGQLYGMADTLTYRLVDKTLTSTPCVIKYVPYGALQDVMPYLGRRAIENKSVLGDGAAAAERRRIRQEIWKKFFG